MRRAAADQLYFAMTCAWPLAPIARLAAASDSRWFRPRAISLGTGSTTTPALMARTISDMPTSGVVSTGKPRRIASKAASPKFSDNDDMAGKDRHARGDAKPSRLAGKVGGLSVGIASRNHDPAGRNVRQRSDQAI